MTNDDADQAIQALHDAQRAAFLLSMQLHRAGDNTGATDAQNRADRLRNEIDNLVNKELTAWQAGAEAIIPQLNRAATAAQTAVDQVKADVGNAQKVSAAMQALDKAVDLAMKFVG
jgi:hypothetical protein